MKKISLFCLLVSLIVVFSACTEKTEKYEDGEGNVKEFTYVTKEGADKFALFEKALSEKGIDFEVEIKAEGIIDGITEGRKYILASGKTVEVFKFDVKSEAYKEAAKTSKLYMEMFDAYIATVINDEYAMIPANDEEMKILFSELE